MDSFPTLIPIKLELKVSEAKLKAEFKPENEIIGEAKAIKEIPDLECRIDLFHHIRYDSDINDMFIARLTLINIKEDVEINFSFVLRIKSANFLEYDYAYLSHKYDSNCVYVCDSDDLFDPEKKYIVDEEFVIEMKGIIFVKDEANQFKFKKPENWLTDRLWKDEDERDFTVIVKEENGCKSEIKIHKCVVAVRSPVFNRMFKENEEGKVEIIYFDSDTVKLAVAFCYDQDILEKYPEWQKLVELYRFADKYDIEDLKKQTEFYLVDAVYHENICEITNAVIKLNAPKLQDFCYRFLLISAQERIQIKDIDNLDNGIAAEFFKKSLSVENC